MKFYLVLIALLSLLIVPAAMGQDISVDQLKQKATRSADSVTTYTYTADGDGTRRNRAPNTASSDARVHESKSLLEVLHPLDAEHRTEDFLAGSHVVERTGQEHHAQGD